MQPLQSLRGRLRSLRTLRPVQSLRRGMQPLQSLRRCLRTLRTLRAVQSLQPMRGRLWAMRRLQPLCGGRCDEFGLRDPPPRLGVQPVQPLRAEQSLRSGVQSLQSLRS